MSDASTPNSDALSDALLDVNGLIVTLSDACDALKETNQPYVRAHAHGWADKPENASQASPTTPDWKDLHATKTGETKALIGTRAQIRNCARCGNVILAGYNSHIMASLVLCDPFLLTPQLEAAAVILNIHTYEAHGNPGHYTLKNRHHPGITRPNWIQYAPASEIQALAAHRCGIPPLSRRLLQLVPTIHASNYDGPPPF